MNNQQLAAKIWESANQMRSKIEAYDDPFSTWLSAGSDFDVSHVRDVLSAFGRMIHPHHKKLFDGIFNTMQMGLSKEIQKTDRVNVFCGFA